MTAKQFVERIEAVGGSLTVEQLLLANKLPIIPACTWAKRPSIPDFTADDVEFLQELGIAAEEVKQ